MLTIKQWMELADYKITEGDTYMWNCYSKNAYCLDSWNGIHGKGGYGLYIVFSTKTQKVYEVSVCDYTNNRAYRMIAEDKREKYRKEVAVHPYGNEAWDGVNYIDLEVDEDFLEKAQAIKEGKEYSTDILIPLDIPDEELLQYMIIAHKRNITFNELCTEALRHAIESHELDPEGAKQRAKEWLNEVEQTDKIPVDDNSAEGIESDVSNHKSKKNKQKD